MRQYERKLVYLLNNLSAITLKMNRKMLKTIAQRKLSMLRPGTTAAASIKSKALITKVKRPRVIMLIGRVRIIKIGRIIALMTPMTKAAKRAAVKLLT